MTVTAINSFEEFQTLINGSKPIVIDFWATWCGPCRVISPVLEELSKSENFANIGFYKVDVDQQQQISQEVGIRANGNKLGELVGANPPALQVIFL
ncbi:hypothetical protein H0H93_001891 [Arthromyces matolae]|nr:hypothetical protein H0H93_001891 [Arthromyces matolae]